MEQFNLKMDDNQYKINFDDSIDKDMEPTNDEGILELSDTYRLEQIEIAKQYKIVDSEKLVKKEDGRWYFNDMYVADYDKLMSENDNKMIYKRDL